MPGKKFVHKTTCDNYMSRMNDPVQSFAYFKPHSDEKNIGFENIAGYKCQHTELHRSGELVFSCWFSEELNFPVRIENNSVDETYMELKEIEEWEPNSSYFSIPGDYTEVDEKMRPVIPEPPAPEKWETQNGTTPFKGKLSRGTILKLKVTESVYHKFIVSNESESPGKFIRHMYRNGAELSEDEQGPVNYRTKRLMPGENKTYTFDWKKGDEIRIYVHEGTLKFEIKPE